MLETCLKDLKESNASLEEQVNFCNSVIDVLDDYDKLSAEAKLLTEKIYNFIEKNNEN